MMDAGKTSVTIIGTGALGSTLMLFLKEKGYKIRSGWNSKGGYVYSEEDGEYHEKSATVPSDESEAGNLIFITTPDDLISETARSLSEKPISWEEKIVVHCSGNLTSDELKALSHLGAKTVSMHPIQTFTKGDGVERFKSITVGLQGDSEAKDQLKTVINQMGAAALLLDKKQKRFLHIAAVMASNYLVALMFSVENLLKDAHLEDGLNSLETLIRQTSKNIFEKGPQNALTGPVSRGDSKSVHTHLEELKGREQEKLYKILGLEALKIAEKSGQLDEHQLNGLKEVLSQVEEH